MFNVKQGLDFIQTLNLASANQYSDPLPSGSYLGLMLYFYGTHSGSVDPNNAMGQVRLNIQGLGDIVNASLNNIQTINNFLGGLPDDTAGTTFHASVLIPFTFFGLPNALMVRPEDEVKLWIQSAQTTITTFSCEISGIYGQAPENFIPIISQDRYNTLGGLATEVIAVRNLIAVWLATASTTNPDLISIESNNFSNSFSFASAQYFSDLNFNVESASLSSILLPLMNTDIADAINDTTRLKFSGGSGYMDFITLSAYFNKARREISTNLTKRYRVKRYDKLAISPSEFFSEKPYGFDATALSDSKA